MEKIEKLIRLLYLEGYEDGKKQKKTPYKYTADSDKGKELYDYVEKQLDKARDKAKIEVLTEIFQTCYQEDSKTRELVEEKLSKLRQ
jgi:hypothetical protein